MEADRGRRQRRYFDWAATAIPDTQDDSQADTAFANPSSKHAEGRAAHAALEEARERCARVLGVARETLYFTSGGSEANTIVLHSVLRKALQGSFSGGILASQVEHPSVLENCRLLERLGVPLTLAGVEPEGRVTPATLDAALDKAALSGGAGLRLVTLMAVNNETGAVNDIPLLVRRLRDLLAASGVKRPVHVHSDMVQALGKIPLDLTACGVDSASFAAHKLGGPRGIGLLYLRKPLEPLALGGGQEGGVRSGTENIAGALAFAACLERHAAGGVFPAAYAAARSRLRRLLGALTALDRCVLIPTARTLDDERFSPYIVQAAFRGIPGEVMARALDDAGFAVSTGSACHSGGADRPVLAAMGVDKRTAFEGIRVSQGYTTTEADIDSLVDACREILKLL